MSIFDDISGFIFGGTDTSAQQAQQAANVQARKGISAATEQARGDVLGLFPQADVSRNLGFQAALDVLGQTIPGQADVFQQGNVGAQQQLLAGLPQFRSAILGGQFDPNALQPTTLNAPMGFAQQTLPEFTPEIRAPIVDIARQPPPGQRDISQLLAQLLGGGSQNVAGLKAGSGRRTGGRSRVTGGGAAGPGPDISGLLGGFSDWLRTPTGRMVSAAAPGGLLAQILNEVLTDEPVKKKLQVGGSRPTGGRSRRESYARGRSESMARERSDPSSGM